MKNNRELAPHGAEGGYYIKVMVAWCEAGTKLMSLNDNNKHW